MFKKLVVVWMTLALLVGLALPASASINPITGNIRIRVNAFNLSNPGALDFEGRLYLTLTGAVNDFTTWKSGIYIGYADLSQWKDVSIAPLKLDYAVVTVAPPNLPIRVEMGALSVDTKGVTAIFGDGYELGGVGGFNIISDVAFPGLYNWLTLSPDVNSTDSGNQEGAALGFGYTIPGNLGRVSGAVWTRKDKDSPGYTVRGLWNVSPGNLTLYAAYGKKAGDTEAKYQVVGINVPAASQFNFNPYIEYDVYNKALGFYTSVTLSTNTSLLLYLSQDTLTKDWKFTPYISFSF